MTSFTPDPDKEYWRGEFSLTLEETRLTRFVSPSPFVPQDEGDRAERCNEILCIAALGRKSGWSTPTLRRRWWACPAAWTPPWRC